MPRKPAWSDPTSRPRQVSRALRGNVRGRDVPVHQPDEPPVHESGGRRTPACERRQRRQTLGGREPPVHLGLRRHMAKQAAGLQGPREEKPSRPPAYLDAPPVGGADAVRRRIGPVTLRAELQIRRAIRFRNRVARRVEQRLPEGAHSVVGDRRHHRPPAARSAHRQPDGPRASSDRQDRRIDRQDLARVRRGDFPDRLDTPERRHRWRCRGATRDLAPLRECLEPIGRTIEPVRDHGGGNRLAVSLHGRGNYPVSDQRGEREDDPPRRGQRVTWTDGPGGAQRRGGEGHADEQRGDERGGSPGGEIHCAAQSRDQLVALEAVSPYQRERERGQQPAEVRPRVIVDRRAAFEPAHGADQDVETEYDPEGEDHQEHREAVREAPHRKLRHIEAGVVLQQGIADAVADSLPGQCDRLPALGAARADEQTQQGAGADRDREENAGGQRFPELEVGDVAAYLDGPDGAIDDEQMTDEPGGREDEAGEVQRQAEDVPVGQKRDGGRRHLLGPPPVGEESGHPSAQEQEADDSGDRGDQPAAATIHGATRERPVRRATRRPRRGRRPRRPNRSPRTEARESPGCSRRGPGPSPWGR